MWRLDFAQVLLKACFLILSDPNYHMATRSCLNKQVFDLQVDYMKKNPEFRESEQK